jgi:hypothetical protein
MNCLCGKKMNLLGEIPPNKKDFTANLRALKLWACPPDGCGRIFLEAKEGSTWYAPEQNDQIRQLFA